MGSLIRNCFLVVRENVDVRHIGGKRDACLPGSVYEFHFAPVLVRDQFLDVAGAAIGWAVSDPEQAGGLGAFPAGKRGANREDAVGNLGGNGRSREQGGNLVEEVVQQKGGSIAGAALKARVSVLDAVTGVCADI